MKPEDLANLAQTAFNARDGESLRALWTDDFHFEGPDGETRSAEEMLAREHVLWRAFPDARATVRTIATGDDVAVLETTMQGVHTGVLSLGARELAPTGKPIKLVFSVHIWLRDGLACRERVFYDRLGMFQQLGAPLS